MRTSLPSHEIVDINSQQIFTLERKINKGEFSIESVGDYLPGNVMVIDLPSNSTEYMNESGCNILKHSIGELEELGPEYLTKFFVMDETAMNMQSMAKMHKNQDTADTCNLQRVKALDEISYKWYFGTAKLLYAPGQTNSEKVIIIVNEVSSLGHITGKINSVLEESDWLKRILKNSDG